MATFSKILIANRGEIACRIIRTAQRMGITTVAVYSDVDRDAAHVDLADEAYAIGAAPARDSYLDGRKIMDVAVASGAQAIHPGYGFLSENAAFAEACQEAGIVFIGPPASAIRAMGGKSEAKALMANAGVPLVPGYHGDGQSVERLTAEAARTGYPVLIKASAGGGGKGMRVAETPETFVPELSAARREAMAAFGDDRMLIEKYLVRPRHIEVQVFADNHGHCYSLFERDCSIQRRHQKVIEEAPAPGLSEELRRRMGDAAISAARAIGYSGAGTVEFLLDARGEFYFMEMNTRLQVEHPVTEFITGLDLVEWQFRVAAGEKLPATWSDLSMHGHAIEVRIYAEDPAHDFLPSIGTVTHLVMPEPGPNVRIDAGLRAGDAVTIHYDPMLAKLIVWDVDRVSAVRRLRKALASIAITGVTSNVDFLGRLSRSPAFGAAELDTGFISQNAASLFVEPQIDDIVVAMAGLGILLRQREAAAREAASSADPHSPWAGVTGFRLNGPAREALCFFIEGHVIELPVTYQRDGYVFECGGATLVVQGRLDAQGKLSAIIDGRKHSGFYLADGQFADLIVGGNRHRIALPDPMHDATDNAAAGGLAAPMPGLVRSILVDVGERVERGQALVVMEAMKMEHTIRAPGDGVVQTLNCMVGAMTEAGVILVEFEPEDG